MGQRREPRKEIKLPVRIFGSDASGKVFSENVTTVNVSREGVKLGGVQASVKPGEIIGLTYKDKKARFTVKWAGQPGTPGQGQLGLLSLAPEKSVWDFPLPSPGIDEFGRHSKGSERRKHPRLKCVNSAELRAEGQSAPIWGRAVDLSLGGCFIEMPIPLPAHTKLKIGLWIQDNKLQLNGKVVNSRPGFGVGVEFTEVAPEDAERLKQFLKSITRLPM
ncbi:MAG: PilZ domain-containing protein [Acidobacteriia bacterium]|nr:PilZ domain-containing protein [Terriglobia bacterium]